MSQEPFGPIVPVLPFSSFEEAIARANASPYGLGAYVFTGAQRIAKAAVLAFEAGSVGINTLKGVPPDLRIAGIKESAIAMRAECSV
jgi:succinate-semialdehyde dehydrogenase/glutarate-semialdehyde dehydrogenase